MLQKRLLEHGAIGPLAAALHYQLGRIAEEHLGRTAEAASHYEQALQHYAEFSPVLWSLDWLLRSLRQYERLATLLERLAESAKTPQLRARRYTLAASIYEFRLGSSSRADSSWERALAADPDYELARWGPLRLHELRREWKSFTANAEALVPRLTTPATRVRVLARQARVAEFRAADLTAAANHYEAAHKERPGFLFDRLRIARMQKASATEQQLLGTLVDACTLPSSTLGLARARALRVSSAAKRRGARGDRRGL